VTQYLTIALGVALVLSLAANGALVRYFDGKLETANEAAAEAREALGKEEQSRTAFEAEAEACSTSVEHLAQTAEEQRKKHAAGSQSRSSGPPTPRRSSRGYSPLLAQQDSTSVLPPSRSWTMRSTTAILAFSWLLMGMSCEQRPAPPVPVPVNRVVQVPCTVPEPTCKSPAYDSATKDMPGDRKAKLLRAETIGQHDCVRLYREALAACR
jgi:hypothetical protein